MPITHRAIVVVVAVVVDAADVRLLKCCLCCIYWHNASERPRIHFIAVTFLRQNFRRDVVRRATESAAQTTTIRHTLLKIRRSWRRQTSHPVPPSGNLNQVTLFDDRLVPPPGELDETYASSLIRANSLHCTWKHDVMHKTKST